MKPTFWSLVAFPLTARHVLFLPRYAYNFCVDFLKTIALKNNEVTLSAAEMFSVDSSFWRYKVFSDIRGVLKFLCKFSLDLRIPVSIYMPFWLFSKLLKTAIL